MTRNVYVCLSLPSQPHRMFERIANDKGDEDLECKVEVSYMEIYNEQINDLLNPKINEGQGKNLKIVRDDPQLGAILGDLTEIKVTSKDEALAAMEKGNSARQTASTNMNARSSRSHTVFKIAIKSSKSEELKLELFPRVKFEFT